MEYVAREVTTEEFDGITVEYSGLDRSEVPVYVELFNGKHFGRIVRMELYENGEGTVTAALYEKPYVEQVRRFTVSANFREADKGKRPRFRFLRNGRERT